jgi:hypothetical protein
VRELKAVPGPKRYSGRPSSTAPPPQRLGCADRSSCLAARAFRTAALASDILAQKLAAAGHKGPVRSRVTFRTLVRQYGMTGSRS